MQDISGSPLTGVVTACFMAVLAVFPVTAQAHSLVDVGGHRLDVLRAGSRGPVIVLEAGLGDAMDDWELIWPGVAKFAQVVAYSRSGLGASQPGGDHSARGEMAELHTLLTRLRLPPPYILVGRSYGGLLVRLYTSLYPRDVGGLVLVDGTHEQQVRRWGEIDSRYPQQFREYFDSVLKTMKPGADADETRETVRIQAAGKVEGMAALPDIPIAVLTSMKVTPNAPYVNGTAKGHDAWRAMHDEWFHRSRDGIHIVTTRSGHPIQHDEPQLVIDAINFVVNRVATRSADKSP